MDVDVWKAMMWENPSPDEQSTAITDACSELAGLVRETPRIRETLVGIVDRALASPAKSERWDRYLEGVSDYLGQGFAYFLMWLSYTSEDRLLILSEHCDNASISLLRELAGLFGAEIRRASEGVGIDDWSSFRVYVLVDQLNGDYRIRGEMVKYSDETLLFETTPDGTMDVCRYLLEALAKVGEIGVFSENSLSSFRDAIVGVQPLVGGGPGSESTSVVSPS